MSKVIENMINGFTELPKTKRKKLIIHETDCHGCGNVYFDGKCASYSYDDSYYGDLRLAVKALQELGVPFGCEVEIYDGDEIYKVVAERN